MKKFLILMIGILIANIVSAQKTAQSKLKPHTEDTLLWYRNLQLNRNDLLNAHNKIVRYYNKYNSRTSQFEYVDSISICYAKMIMILEKKDSISDLQMLDDIGYTMTTDHKTKRKFLSINQAKELIHKNTLVIQNAEFLLRQKTEENFENFMSSCLNAISLFKNFFPS